ncbi:MAG: ligand-binding sensor domain-containing protein [Lacibacter sp.]
MRKYFFQSLLLFITTQAFAQKPLQFSFTHYTTETGLLSNQINTVVQDEQGYLWIGTIDGLQRYDGVRYKVFKHIEGDSSSIPSSHVQQLIIDSKKRIWLLAGDGTVGIWDHKKLQFKQAAVRYKHPNIQYVSKSLRADEYGHVFYHMPSIVTLTFHERRNEFSEKHNFFKTKPGTIIAEFVQQPGTKRYWISIHGGGLAVYNDVTKTISYAGRNVEKIKAIDFYEGAIRPYNIFFDKQNRLWFQSWGPGYPELFAYDLKQDKPLFEKMNFHTKERGYYETRPFFLQSKGNVWISGLKVLARFNETTRQFEFVAMGTDKHHGIDAISISGMYEDRKQNIWIGTGNNGLYRFNPEEEYFTNIKHINHVSGKNGYGSVMSFMEMNDGTVVTGTWGDGLYRYDKQWNLVPLNLNGLENKNFYSAWSMYRSKDSNTIWIGLQPSVGKIDQKNNRFTVYYPRSLPQKTVRSISEDVYGNLWLGLNGNGLYKWNAQKGKTDFNAGIEKISFIPDRNINKIINDNKGNVWVATATDGVFVIDPATNRQLLLFNNAATGAYKLPEEAVSGLLQYNDTAMLISLGKRIVLYNTVKKTSRVIVNPANMSGYLSSMEKDSEGYLWVTSSNGLYRVDLLTRVVIRFERSDGMDNDNFILASSYKFKDGRLLFGSPGNAIVFQPSAMRLSEPTLPAVVINEFKVLNQPLLVDSLLQQPQIVLQHQQNSLEIAFTTMNFANPYLIRYKMEKLDKEWRVAERDFNAVYSYLPPGTYRFLVKAEDAGMKSGPVTTLTIVIKPPFWKSWWFYGLLLLFGAGLLYWIDKERMKRKEALLQMRTSIANNLHEEVNTALNNINMLSEMARIKADKDAEKSKEFIEQIHSKSHNMIIAMDDMLWSIDPENDSMEKTVLRLNEYIAAQNNRNNSLFELQVDERILKLKLNMQLRHETFLLFKETIVALIKANVQQCRIFIGLERGSLMYTAEFSNEGGDMQQLTNVLHSNEMTRRQHALHAVVDTNFHKNHSILTLKIPADRPGQ